jgi:hypothetical protein
MAPWNTDEVFVHERRASGGEKRLVAVGFDPVAFAVGSEAPFKVGSWGYTNRISALEFSGATGDASLRFAVAPDEPLKLYAGQPDPADESHFTIDYETPTGRGTIDGWLMPDDTVKLQIRDGPAK